MKSQIAETVNATVEDAVQSALIQTQSGISSLKESLEYDLGQVKSRLGELESEYATERKRKSGEEEKAGKTNKSNDQEYISVTEGMKKGLSSPIKKSNPILSNEYHFMMLNDVGFFVS